MEDQNDPRISAYRPPPQDARRWRVAGARGARWRMPVPPWGGPPDLTGAEREREARARARAEALGARLHLRGLINGGVIVMGVMLAAVIVMLAWVVIFR